MRHFLPVFASILTFSSLATSSLTMALPTPEISRVLLVQKLDCSNPENLPQQSMNRCAELSYQQADKKLNQVYKQLTAKLEAPRVKKLVAAQQAWIKFRDASCKFESSEVEGGTMEPLLFYGCLTRTTKERTKSLQ
ncbi:MAG: DUF1311 domain-containing protein [Cyanomargarita calcarea GSE-NOS-MK-12-04C]|jgi:uncharacterized protein YecT (DUF1311 family)|uniref:DUF1311 domain-containing protein n=1 Tax=Cyanomargarita calcarea GSE-NOS-MK-12-04C TaxID=2839659 RepID=A0A951QRA4_9CYAN|nr:DUF1311 domain-containing protein [Cyanomargarita calcarea GSE-NOS-MK-12-04C]